LGGTHADVGDVGPDDESIDHPGDGGGMYPEGHAFVRAKIPDLAVRQSGVSRRGMPGARRNDAPGFRGHLQNTPGAR